MREGPPISLAGAPSCDGSLISNMSASNLLREITSLRSRLRELEDDTKSGISEDGSTTRAGSTVSDSKEMDFLNLLKAQLTKLEQDKADMELDFMNQISRMQTEHQEVLVDLNDKIDRYENENDSLHRRLRTTNSGDEIERITRRMEEEREYHTEEIEKLKQNIASADEEISESKREIDFLQEQVMELETERDNLAEEATLAKDSLDAEKAKAEKYRKELDHAKEKIQDLTEQLDDKEADNKTRKQSVMDLNEIIENLKREKSRLESDNKDLKAEIQSQEGITEHLRAKVEKLESSGKTGSSESQSKDTDILEDSVKRLEERLQRFQSKLHEKDRTIDNLASSLSDERKLNKSLRAELISLRGVTSINSGVNSLSPGRYVSPPNGQDKAELESLRRINKELLEEIQELRRATNQDYPSTPPRSPSKRLARSISSPKISGIVASFEQRSVRNAAPSHEARDVESLRRELQDEKDNVLFLKDKLRRERETVDQLRFKTVPFAGQTVPSRSLEALLRDSEREVNRLNRLVDDHEMKYSSQDREIRSYKARIEELESLAEVAEHDAQLYHDRVVECEREIRLLKQDADFRGMDEKKDDFDMEELVRLRAQVAALQPELDRTLTQIEELQDEIASLKKALRSEQITATEAQTELSKLKLQESSVIGESSKKFEAEMNALRIEITKLRVEKESLERESKDKITELETEMEAIEREADEDVAERDKEILDLQNQLSIKEREINRLEYEKGQLCNNMNDVSFSRKDEMEELQAELIDLTAKTTAQTREIQSLKMKLEDVQGAKKEVEQRLHQRIRELEYEIEEVRIFANKGESGNLQEENQKLRDAVREYKTERRLLQDRLKGFTDDKRSSKSVQVLRERNAQLKAEVEKLTRRLQKMESSITRVAI